MIPVVRLMCSNRSPTAHSLCSGHHYEDGYNAVEFKEVYDCWARDIATVGCKL